MKVSDENDKYKEKYSKRNLNDYDGRPSARR